MTIFSNPKPGQPFLLGHTFPWYAFFFLSEDDTKFISAYVLQPQVDLEKKPNRSRTLRV